MIINFLIIIQEKMAIIKCKICGGTLQIKEGQSIAVCEYCNTKQTLPHMDDEKKLQMYERANQLRRNNEFDKAMGIYEQVLIEDATDSYAYWSLVLCRYGVEYVEEPITKKRKPTINRTQTTSVFNDENYKCAIQYADIYQKEIYQKEAREIDEIQKQILEISQKENPFDIFICYKETDTHGRRTQDSVIAQEMYYQLIKEGYKVFFSRITLEDKLGEAYEPYIYSALNSAKVMIVVGTKEEHFNSIWVKNEWKRYLGIMNNDINKVLIPAYKDMDPYDLPIEFSNLQAQDMSKIGFMQDLIYGIKKIIARKAENNYFDVNRAGSNYSDVEQLLKRVDIFLNDKEWEKAEEYSEKILDMDPQNARAYLDKVLIGFKLDKKEDLYNIDITFLENDINYRHANEFADEELLKLFIGIKKNAESKRENYIIEKMNEADTYSQNYEYDKAKVTVADIIQNYPEDYRGWKKMIEVWVLCIIHDNKLIPNSLFENILQIKKYYKTLISLKKDSIIESEIQTYIDDISNKMTHISVKRAKIPYEKKVNEINKIKADVQNLREDKLKIERMDNFDINKQNSVNLGKKYTSISMVISGLLATCIGIFSSTSDKMHNNIGVILAISIICACAIYLVIMCIPFVILFIKRIDKKDEYKRMQIKRKLEIENIEKRLNVLQGELVHKENELNAIQTELLKCSENEIENYWKNIINYYWGKELNVDNDPVLEKKIKSWFSINEYSD